MVVSVRVPFIGQIDLFENFQYLIGILDILQYANKLSITNCYYRIGIIT